MARLYSLDMHEENIERKVKEIPQNTDFWVADVRIRDRKASSASTALQSPRCQSLCHLEERQK